MLLNFRGRWCWDGAEPPPCRHPAARYSFCPVCPHTLPYHRGHSDHSVRNSSPHAPHPSHPPSWHVPSCDTACFLVYLSCVYLPTRIQELRARVLCGSPLYPQCLACGRTWHLQNVWMSPSWINVQSLGFSLFLLTGPLMIWADSEGVPGPMALGGVG